jgi:hypothetical protein
MTPTGPSGSLLAVVANDERLFFLGNIVLLGFGAV